MRPAVLLYNQKEKGAKTMKRIDLSIISDHVDNDRRNRFAFIEKTIGFGTPIAEAEDKKERGDCTRTLTGTGVIVVIDPYGVIVTAWIASVKQAIDVYSRATGNNKLPKEVFWMVQYNNNSPVWKTKVAA
jgi:hypothetical protein